MLANRRSQTKSKRDFDRHQTRWTRRLVNWLEFPQPGAILDGPCVWRLCESNCQDPEEAIIMLRTLRLALKPFWTFGNCNPCTVRHVVIATLSRYYTTLQNTSIPTLELTISRIISWSQVFLEKWMEIHRNWVRHLPARTDDRHLFLAIAVVNQAQTEMSLWRKTAGLEIFGLHTHCWLIANDILLNCNSTSLWIDGKSAWRFFRRVNMRYHIQYSPDPDPSSSSSSGVAASSDCCSGVSDNTPREDHLTFNSDNFFSDSKIAFSISDINPSVLVVFHISTVAFLAFSSASLLPSVRLFWESKRTILAFIWDNSSGLWSHGVLGMVELSRVPFLSSPPMNFLHPIALTQLSSQTTCLSFLFACNTFPSAMARESPAETVSIIPNTIEATKMSRDVDLRKCHISEQCKYKGENLCPQGCTSITITCLSCEYRKLWSFHLPNGGN